MLTGGSPSASSSARFCFIGISAGDSFVEEAVSHGQTPETAAYLNEMLRDTFENWQSEFLQLLWQVLGLAYFLYVGSPSSKENDDRH